MSAEQRCFAFHHFTEATTNYLGNFRRCIYSRSALSVFTVDVLQFQAIGL